MSFLLVIIFLRWRNFITRGMSGISLLTGFSIIVWMGPIGLIFLVSLYIFAISLNTSLERYFFHFDITNTKKDFGLYLSRYWLRVNISRRHCSCTISIFISWVYCYCSASPCFSLPNNISKEIVQCQSSTRQKTKK